MYVVYACATCEQKRSLSSLLFVVVVVVVVVFAGAGAQCVELNDFSNRGNMRQVSASAVTAAAAECPSACTHVRVRTCSLGLLTYLCVHHRDLCAS